MNRRLAPLLVALAIAVSACTSAGPPSPAAPAGMGVALARVPRAPASPGDAANAASAIDAFGLDLYRHVVASAGGGNVVLSPASIALALAMARAGARGETAAQMDTVLRSVGSETNGAGINALDQALASRNGTFRDADGHDMTVALRIANAPFAQAGESWNPAFLDALGSRFGAGLRLVDYVRDTEAARRLINGWVSDQTEHRIPELIGGGILDATTRLTLVNAVYLKAPWARPFDGTTKAATFTREDGSTVEVLTMATLQSLRYGESAGWRAVELPYVGGSLVLDVIVPDRLGDFESTLSPKLLDAVLRSLQEQEVSLTLPKFKVATSTSLADVLRGMGMPLAFEPGTADFSGMTTQDRLFISAVIHQANIEVDEKGTEASAATAVVMAASGVLQSIAFRVDRPFVFALRDVPTGSILFLGRVVDPSAGS